MVNIEFSEWTEAKLEIKKRFSSPDWVYRGQSSAIWPLETSLKRWIDRNKSICNRVIDAEFGERVFLRYFKENSGKILDQTPTTDLEWFGLMQHFGTPTRLLDFTNSAYIAAYFAYRSVGEKDQKCAIWALNQKWCRKVACQLINEIHRADLNFQPIQDPNDTILEERFEEIFTQNPKALSLVMPIASKIVNERMRMQEGLFLCPGNAFESFAEQLEELEGCSHNVVKIILPCKDRNLVIPDLNEEGINAEHLFSNLDGFAESVKNYIYLEHP